MTLKDRQEAIERIRELRMSLLSDPNRKLDRDALEYAERCIRWFEENNEERGFDDPPEL